MHANWIVRMDETGTASDVSELIELIQKSVSEDSGVMLHSEVVRW
jgi:UDP-N-acetylenolpyruvoylglucosamine reductase